MIKLDGPGPWPVAALGDSTKIAVGDVTGTVGMDEEGSLVATPGTVKSIRSFAASWEYMLDRALFVAPYNSAFGGAALVDGADVLVVLFQFRQRKDAARAARERVDEAPDQFLHLAERDLAVDAEAPAILILRVVRRPPASVSLPASH